MTEPQPWDRREGETNRWWQRFEAFRLLGPGRSLTEAVNQERVRKGRERSESLPGSWRRIAIAFDWRARAEAWDAAMTAQKEAAIKAAQAAAEAAWRERIMGPAEILARLSEQARNSIATFVSEAEVHLPPPREGEPEVVIKSGEVSWEAIKQFGHLIKKISFNQYGPVLELYNVQDALKLMGQHEKLFTESVNVSMTQEIKGYTGVSPDDWDSTET
jgi:hypothetical protein